jgi:hypothetical protein
MVRSRAGLPLHCLDLEDLPVVLEAVQVLVARADLLSEVVQVIEGLPDACFKNILIGVEVLVLDLKHVS